VLDADGIVAFKGEPESLKGRAGLVLTPHVGELAVLVGRPVHEVARAGLAAARNAAAATGQVVLLKGSSTVIARPRVRPGWWCRVPRSSPLPAPATFSPV